MDKLIKLPILGTKAPVTNLVGTYNMTPKILLNLGTYYYIFFKTTKLITN